MGKEFKKIIKLIIIIFDGILEIIYPRVNYCIICRNEDCSGLCTKCRNDIHRIKDTSGSIESYGYYGGVLKKLILKFKYYSDFTAGDILAELLEEYMEESFDYRDFVITYIPLTKKSKRKRGFNQCEYIAKKISRHLNIPCKELLVKKSENKEQKKLKYSERFDNVKNIFKLKNNIDIKDLKIIIIDDVTTSGATMEEACRILKKYDIKEIKLLTLAKSHI